MDLSFGSEYSEFRDEVKHFLATYNDQQPSATGAGMSPVEWQKLLIKNGYHSRTIAKEYGGYGAEPDIIKSRIIAEEFSQAQINTGLGGQGISMLVPVLLEMGTEEQKQQFVRPTIEGEMVWCQGYSEPGAGSDLASLTTKAELDGDEWLINGQKIWTSTAHLADWIFCLVRTGAADVKNQNAISFLLIDMKTPGINLSPIYLLDGSHEVNEVHFDNVRVPAANLIGEEGKGWTYAKVLLTHERTNIAGVANSKVRLASLKAKAAATCDGGAMLGENTAWQQLSLIHISEPTRPY